MKLFDLDEKTKLPVPSGELLMIPIFKELIKRKRPIDGDYDGRLKHFNMMELAYIYFMGVWDSKFKLHKESDKILAVKKLIGLPEEWKPDLSVLEALNTYVELQITESSGLAEVLGKTVQNLTIFLENGQQTIATLGIDRAEDVSEFLAILDKVPKTVEQLKQTREKLLREQEAIGKGRKGRTLNKFEVPD